MHPPFLMTSIYYICNLVNYILHNVFIHCICKARIPDGQGKSAVTPEILPGGGVREGVGAGKIGSHARNPARRRYQRASRSREKRQSRQKSCPEEVSESKSEQGKSAVTPEILPGGGVRERVGAGKIASHSRIPARRRLQRASLGKENRWSLQISCTEEVRENKFGQGKSAVTPEFLPGGGVRERVGAWKTVSLFKIPARSHGTCPHGTFQSMVSL